MTGTAQGQEASVDVHQPFTKAEHFQQLADIDHDITTLLTHAGKAMQSLVQPDPGDSNEDSASVGGISAAGSRETNPAAKPLDPEERLAEFRLAMDAFMKDLHSVDVRLKRQIWALEEAGIITLKGADGREPTAEGAGAAADAGELVKRRLEPDGIGNIGSLDVGWLNSRSNKVDRIMESELWAEARKHLEGIAEDRIRTGGAAVGLGHADASEQMDHMEE